MTVRGKDPLREPLLARRSASPSKNETRESDSQKHADGAPSRRPAPAVQVSSPDISEATASTASAKGLAPKGDAKADRMAFGDKASPAMPDRPKPASPRNPTAAKVSSAQHVDRGSGSSPHLERHLTKKSLQAWARDNIAYLRDFPSEADSDYKSRRRHMQDILRRCPADLKGKLIVDALTVTGDLTTLPPGLTVSGQMRIIDCPGLKQLPKNLAVGALVVINCPKLQSLPEGFFSAGDVKIYNCAAFRHKNHSMKVGGLLTVQTAKDFPEKPLPDHYQLKQAKVEKKVLEGLCVITQRSLVTASVETKVVVWRRDDQWVGALYGPFTKWWNDHKTDPITQQPLQEREIFRPTRSKDSN